MPRIKSEKQLIQIDTWEQADAILRGIGDNQLKINQAESSAKEKIDEIKEKLAEAVKKAIDDTKIKVKSLEAFCLHHRGDFAGQKSRRLNYGTIGWRRSVAIETNRDTLELLQSQYGGKELMNLLHIKKTVNKEAVAKLTDEQLADINAQRKTRDMFFAEPDLPKAVDYTE